MKNSQISILETSNLSKQKQFNFTPLKSTIKWCFLLKTIPNKDQKERSSNLDNASYWFQKQSKAQLVYLTQNNPRFQDPLYETILLTIEFQTHFLMTRFMCFKRKGIFKNIKSFSNQNQNFEKSRNRCFRMRFYKQLWLGLIDYLNKFKNTFAAVTSDKDQSSS